MKCLVAIVVLLATAGTSLALAPDSVPKPQQQVLVQFSVGTGTTSVGFKVTRQAVLGSIGLTSTPGRFCLRLPFGCALVMESSADGGPGIVVRPQVGPIALEVAVDQVRPNGS
jgi:hypothetical protein